MDVFIELLAQSMLYLSASPISMILATASAMYFASRFQIANATIVHKVNNTIYPIRYLLNYLLIENLGEIRYSHFHVFRNALTRIIIVVPCFVFYIIYILIVFGSTPDMNVKLYIRFIFIIFYTVTLIYAWRFGYDLKSVESELSAKNTNQSDENQM